MSMPTTDDGERVKGAMRGSGVEPLSVRVRQLEGERIYVVTVSESDVSVAMSLARELEELFADESESVVFSVRSAPSAPITAPGPVRTLSDPRVGSLVQLLASRSQTSEAQPSLSYIPNNTANIAAVTGTRHHLVFGRRGAGKTALLLEARREIGEHDHATAWMNMQPLRNEGVERTFLHVARVLLESLATELHARDLTHAQFSKRLSETRALLRAQLNRATPTTTAIRRMIPEMQASIKRVTTGLGGRIFLFLDDFYYVPRIHQPDVLDLLHSITRDSDVWLKVSSIRHLTRWYRPSPPTGLQTGQDVDIIDLDLSLQDPRAAASFLSQVLTAYCNAANINTTANVISKEALDRLVFASGGVPRDFLTLAASAISIDRDRAGARTVGISAVNQAAGEAARAKVGELEDDLASNAGYTAQTGEALTRVRNFCLDERGFTYFRISFRDKERNPDEYGVLTRLLEVRLVHLIDPAVSDPHRAGERSECYTLDLSQYSGYRLKQGIRVLDISDGRLVSKQTRITSKTAADGRARKLLVGSTPRQVVSILRGAPLLQLSTFADLVSKYEPAVDLVERALRSRSSLQLDELVVMLNRPYNEIASVIAQLMDNGLVNEVDVEGAVAYRLVR